MSIKKRYQLEAALRPIVEFHSAALAVLTALTAWLFQYYLLMPPIIAAAVCVLLTGYALWRLNDAFTLWYYQRHLTRLPRYVLSPARIPVSDRTLFLGKGFQWQQKHTQRLRDLLLPKNEHYLRESRREAEKELDDQWKGLSANGAGLSQQNVKDRLRACLDRLPTDKAKDLFGKIGTEVFIKWITEKISGG